MKSLEFFSEREQRPFITDGGLETCLIYKHGIELPYFAAFTLLKSESGRETLRSYFRSYAELARQYRVGIVLESVTWRASRDWGEELAITKADMEQLNIAAVEELHAIRQEYESESSPILVSGCVGPRGDGYRPDATMSAAHARDYHLVQIESLATADVDFITAMTLNYVDEAVGITRAAMSLGQPVVLSFTVETDGKMPTGHSLREAIEQIDEETSGYPAHYMINCAHPTHFEHALNEGDWLGRIGGIRANASKLSHIELDEADVLDEGDPQELAHAYLGLRARLSGLKMMGGCCGTDIRHIQAICETCIGEPTIRA